MHKVVVCFHLTLFFLLSFGFGAETTYGNTNKKKLVALFHAGPGKTGTTHLQAFLMKTEKLLQKKNYTLWPNLYSSFLDCISSGTLSPSEAMMNDRLKTLAFYNKYFKRCIPMQNTLRHFIRDSAKHNLNVIFSSETFLSFSPGVKNIMDMLRAENYQIHGVMTYRFPLSWFISRYKEEIKTSSITSRESNPLDQLTDLIFSEYLKKRWNVYFQPHPFTAFYQGLSTYPDFRLSIVDLYGTVAVKRDLSYVFLCKIAGIMCHSPKYTKLIALKSHTSESQTEIVERQLGFVFAKFASERNCHLSFSEKHGKARKFLYNKRKWSTTIPQRSVNISAYAQLSVEMDRNFRTHYGEYIINGNAEANALQVSPLPVVMEVDREAVVGESKGRFFMEFRSRLVLARKKGLCQQKPGVLPS